MMGLVSYDSSDEGSEEEKPQLQQPATKQVHNAPPRYKPRGANKQAGFLTTCAVTSYGSCPVDRRSR